MAVYTELDKRELADIVEDYGLVKLLAAHGIPAGSVNTNYLLETARGKHLLRVDEVKGELEVKRELDLLLFLRKHGFPCPQPLADRKGRHYREAGGKCLSVYRYYDGHPLNPARVSAGQLVKERGLGKLRDTGALDGVVEEIVSANPSQVALYRSGKTQTFGWFVGQVMKKTGGRADPGQVRAALEAKLGAPAP